MDGKFQVLNLNSFSPTKSISGIKRMEKKEPKAKGNS